MAPKNLKTQDNTKRKNKDLICSKRAFQRCNTVNATKNADLFITVDSGETKHAVNNGYYSELVSIVEHRKLTVADEGTVVAINIGKVLVQVGEQQILLRTVYYVSCLNRDVLSC